MQERPKEVPSQCYCLLHFSTSIIFLIVISPQPYYRDHLSQLFRGKVGTGKRITKSHNRQCYQKCYKDKNCVVRERSDNMKDATSTKIAIH